MALGGPPRNHENEPPPSLFSHQYLAGKFSEVEFPLYSVLGNREKAGEGNR
jgi:hypothetical protein